MKKAILVAVTLLGILALVTVGVSATDGNLVVNGDFEAPIVTAGAGWDIFDSGTLGLGWTVEWYNVPPTWGSYTRPDPAHLELHRGVNNWLPHDGDQHAELDTDWNGPVAPGPNGEPANVRIYQDIPTCPGGTYDLSYAWSPRPGHADNALEVRWDGNWIATYTKTGSGNTDWQPHLVLGLVASTDTTRLEFIEVGNPDSLGMFLDAVSVTGPTHPCVIEVDIDIKPGSCPNPLNSKRKGVLPVAVLGTEGFDVTTIDPATIRLTREGYDGVPPLRWSYEDVATPFEGELCECHDLNGDGYLDLTLKFSTQEVIATLGLEGEAGNTIPLLLTGNLKEEFDRTPIEGSDCVRVLSTSEE